ncbi:MAG: hypothetical protein EU536_04200 [Promethearchaeota archaeon]|nr:MAG: hypothetical protein EU536_04200 [Candidatus Lokiarchaeota archaeon]
MSSKPVKKIILDSTYLLPLIGIDVGIPEDDLKALFISDHEILINEVSIFEIMGKGLREVIRKKLPYNRLLKGLASLKEDERIQTISLKDTLAFSNLIGLIFQSGLQDIPDCMILSTAMNCDIFITEAKDIPKTSSLFKEFQHVEIINWTLFKRRFLSNP